MDVGGWLGSLGLGQYEALFRASEIDADILSDLTEVDLEKLGVPLGHRKRLLRAISGLAAAETSAAPSVSRALPPACRAAAQPYPRARTRSHVRVAWLSDQARCPDAGVSRTGASGCVARRRAARRAPRRDATCRCRPPETRTRHAGSARDQSLTRRPGRDLSTVNRTMKEGAHDCNIWSRKRSVTARIHGRNQ
jgi:SAM domain (Sterile alpha motif)